MRASETQVARMVTRMKYSKGWGSSNRFRKSSLGNLECSVNLLSLISLFIQNNEALV